LGFGRGPFREKLEATGYEGWSSIVSLNAAIGIILGISSGRRQPLNIYIGPGL